MMETIGSPIRIRVAPSHIIAMHNWMSRLADGNTLKESIIYQKPVETELSGGPVRRIKIVCSSDGRDYGLGALFYPGTVGFENTQKINLLPLPDIADIIQNRLNGEDRRAEIEGKTIRIVHDGETEYVIYQQSVFLALSHGMGNEPATVRQIAERPDFYRAFGQFLGIAEILLNAIYEKYKVETSEKVIYIDDADKPKKKVPRVLDRFDNVIVAEF